MRTDLAVIRAAQTESGAILACPTYPTYRYSWLRDGSFTGDAILGVSPAWWHGWLDAADQTLHQGEAGAGQDDGIRLPDGSSDLRQDGLPMLAVARVLRVRVVASEAVAAVHGAGADNR